MLNEDSETCVYIFSGNSTDYSPALDHEVPSFKSQTPWQMQKHLPPCALDLLCLLFLKGQQTRIGIAFEADAMSLFKSQHLQWPFIHFPWTQENWQLPVSSAAIETI